jgi:probable F420-dependent oxidoreductase
MLKISFFPSRFNELPNGDLKGCLDVARMVDGAGLYGIQLGDHLIVGNRRDRYPYGVYRHEVDTPWLEPVATLSAMASITTGIRLSMGVMLAPLRPAILLAKQLATLDVLSGGRCEPGVGTGWQREEYRGMGLSWAARQDLFEESIAACRALWGPQPVTFSSPTVELKEVYAAPVPTQARIPILYGVRVNDRSADMIARLGDGWTPVGSLEELADGTERLRKAFVSAGRDPEELIVRAGLPLIFDDDKRIDLARTMEQVPAYRAAGASVFTLALPVGYGKLFTTMRELEQFISEVGRQAEASDV